MHMEPDKPEGDALPEDSTKADEPSGGTVEEAAGVAEAGTPGGAEAAMSDRAEPASSGIRRLANPKVLLGFLTAAAAIAFRRRRTTRR